VKGGPYKDLHFQLPVDSKFEAFDRFIFHGDALPIFCFSKV
jgi:hypothetical protein